MSRVSRIIPCLDIDAGRVVKGTCFVGLKDAGDPAAIAKYYDQQGADEIVFLDITASSGRRDTLIDVVKAVASQVFIPLTVGGGIRNIDNISRMLDAGADKVSLNTAAIDDPSLITATARHFGSQCIVVAIDAKKSSSGRWEVYSYGGRRNTGLDAIGWAIEVARLGAGEILLTSMDRDGTKKGFDLSLTQAVSDAVTIPLIASGGVGKLQHLVDGIKIGRADAVLAASVFHFGIYTIAQAKEFMVAQDIEVRPV